MFWLVRHLTGHAGAAAVAAVLYAFSHFRFGQLGHIQVLSHQWLPLMLLGLHRAAQGAGQWRDVWLAAGAFTLQALSSGYQAFLAAIAGTLFVAWLGLPGLAAAPRPLAGAGGPGRCVGRAPGPTLAAATPGRTRPAGPGHDPGRGDAVRRSARDVPGGSGDEPVARRRNGAISRRRDRAVPGSGRPRPRAGRRHARLATAGGRPRCGDPARPALAGCARCGAGRGPRRDGRQLAARRRVLPPVRAAPALAAELRMAPSRNRGRPGAAPRPPRSPAAPPRAGLASPAGVAEWAGLLCRADARRRHRVLRAAAGARPGAPPSAALCAALRARPRLRRLPGPGTLRRSRDDRARGPGRIRRRGPCAPAPASPLEDRGAGRARGAGGDRELGGAPAARDRLTAPGGRRPVARRPARARGRRRPADVRAERHVPRELPAVRLDRALASARERVRERLSARLCRRHRHAEHVPRAGGRRAAPGDPRSLRGRQPRPVPTGATRSPRSGPGAPAGRRQPSGGVRAHRDLRDRPRGAARVTRKSPRRSRPPRRRGRRRP